MSAQRNKDSLSTLTVLVREGSAIHNLFSDIALRIVTHHYNRCVLQLVDADNGTVHTFNITPGDGNPQRTEAIRDRLNWSTH